MTDPQQNIAHVNYGVQKYDIVLRLEDQECFCVLAHTKLQMRLMCCTEWVWAEGNNGSPPNVVVKSGLRTIPTNPYSPSNAVSALPCLDPVRYLVI